MFINAYFIIMQTIYDLKIGDKIHLILTNEEIVIEFISIEFDLINEKYSQTQIVELTSDKEAVTFKEANLIFMDGGILYYATGEYEDDLALYTEIAEHYGDELGDLYVHTQYYK